MRMIPFLSALLTIFTAASSAASGQDILAAGFRGEGGGLPPPFPAKGVILLGQVPPREFGEYVAQVDEALDCWGYTSSSGRQYALVGLQGGTAFVEVSDPDDPRIVAGLPGPSGHLKTRDIKTYGDYAYSVSEAGGGVQVFDLSRIDEGTVELVNTVTEGGALNTHNLAINEESGFLYRLNDHGRQGLRAYDLADPARPVFVGRWNSLDVHDAQVLNYTSGPFAGREIAFCFTGGAGTLHILDVTDKANMTPIGSVRYSMAAFSHQGWLTPDRRYVYLNDELDERRFSIPTTMRIIDVSDLTNPVEVGTFTNGQNSIDHNLYVVRNRIYSSTYSSGLRIFDITDPLAPIEVAWFDTRPGSAGGEDLQWSSYPFFESGIVIGTDTRCGLFVWWANDPPLRFEYPDGNSRQISPIGHRVPVKIEEEGDTLVPGSAKLHYSLGEEFVSSDLLELDDGTFEARFPELTPGSTLRYYLSAESTRGIVWRDPPDSARVGRVPLPGECGLEPGDAERCGGWTPTDVGATESPGGFRLEASCLQVVGAGGDISRSRSDPRDRFHFVHRTVAGDFRLTAEITDWVDEDTGARLALMVRENLETDARHGSVVLEVTRSGYRHRFLSRESAGGGARLRSHETYEQPGLWLRIEREGDTIRGLLSQNGDDWTEADFVELVGLPPEVTVGVGLADRPTSDSLVPSLATLCNVVFDRGGFLRGDCNGDGAANISDASCVLNWLFSDVAAGPGCVAATNVNGDTSADITDAVYLLNHLFAGGPAPVAPFPDCGPGELPADEALGCANPPNCQ